MNDGQYRICVLGAAAGYLDPCIWNSKPVQVTVKGGVGVQAVKVTADRGATVAVTVADAQGLLQSFNAATAKRPAVTTYLHAPHSFAIPFKQTKLDGQSARFESLMPIKQQVGVMLMSEDFDLDQDSSEKTAFTKQGRGLFANVQQDTLDTVKELKVKLSAKK